MLYAIAIAIANTIAIAITIAITVAITIAFDVTTTWADSRISGSEVQTQGKARHKIEVGPIHHCVSHLIVQHHSF